MNKDMLTPHFSKKEALWLPKWNREADASDGLTVCHMRNLQYVFGKLEVIREMLAGRPIMVTNAFRSIEYNALIGGAEVSSHLEGKAIDFVVKGLSCDEVRNYLLPHLPYLSLRMENVPQGNWVHIDDRKTSGPLFFKP